MSNLELAEILGACRRLKKHIVVLVFSMNWQKRRKRNDLNANTIKRWFYFIILTPRRNKKREETECLFICDNCLQYVLHTFNDWEGPHPKADYYWYIICESCINDTFLKKIELFHPFLLIRWPKV